MFSTNSTYWKPSPVKASPCTKSAAIVRIGSMVADGWTCMPGAVEKTLVVANQSKKRNKLVIIVVDGMPYCGSLTNLKVQETLDALATSNYKRTKVNTVFNSAAQDGIQFFSLIAQLYGGEFIAVN